MDIDDRAEGLWVFLPKRDAFRTCWNIQTFDPQISSDVSFAVDVNPGGVLAVGENAPVVLNPAELVALATAERKRRQEAAASPAGMLDEG